MQDSQRASTESGKRWPLCGQGIGFYRPAGGLISLMGGWGTGQLARMKSSALNGN